MGIDLGLNAASSGLSSINRQMAVISQNVANAGTTGYKREVVSTTDLTTGGTGYGVKIGLATRQTDDALQQALDTQNASVAGQQVRSDALASVDAAQGATGAGNDLASRLGELVDSFTSLGADPSNQAQQAAVVSAAGALADGVRTQAAAYTTARQSAQDGLVSDLTALNAAIKSVGSLSQQIMATKSRGESTADLESQRDAAEQSAAQLGGVRFLTGTGGDVTAVAGGLVINTQGASGPFSVAAATLSDGSAGPAVMLAGVDVTKAINGGSVGARLNLRDSTLPQAQAGLDEFAQTLATRLSNQGLNLFTDASGNLPTLGGTPVQAGYVGFSNTIRVNPAVANTVSLVRDGTNTVTAGTGGASAFAPNPAGGPAGFSTLVARVVQYGFGAQAQAGTDQPAVNTTGLGQDGTQALPYSPGMTLASFAANLVSSQAEAASSAKGALDDGTALQSTLQSKMQDETGVSVDTELSNMVVLQNAYGANAKIISASQSMWSDLLDAVRP